MMLARFGTLETVKPPIEKRQPTPQEATMSETIEKAEAARGVIAADGTTKARIERAAATLFAQSGVDAVTTREIAAAAGISEGAIYRHYAGKEELAAALFAAIHGRLGEAIATVRRTVAGLDERATAIVAAYCDIADSDWTLFAYHLRALHRFLPALGGAAPGPTSAVAETERIVDDAMIAGEIAPGDPRLIAAMALGVVLQAALHKTYGRLDGALSARRAALTAAVIAVLRSGDGSGS